MDAHDTYNADQDDKFHAVLDNFLEDMLGDSEDEVDDIIMN